MMDDMFCDADDMRNLKKICIKYNLAKCHTCWHASPNAGYSSPDCKKRTELGQGKGPKLLDGSPPAFKLELGNIPKKKCEYWKSDSKERERRENNCLVESANDAIRKVPKRLRHRLKGGIA